MAAPQFRLWRQSLCSAANFGAYDAYVMRLERPLGPAELDLFDYPQARPGRPCARHADGPVTHIRARRGIR